jgi:Uma2 family endonuclease
MATVTSANSGPAPLGDPFEESTVKPSPVPDDFFYEVVDGQVVELPPMGVYECGIASLLAIMLGQATRAGKLGRVVVETMFWLDRSGKLKRRPDLAYVSNGKWPPGTKLPQSEAWDIIPDLAIEVVSDSNSANEIQHKLADYLRAGVQQVWVVYPVTRQIYVYTSLTSVQILTEHDLLDGGALLPGIQLSLAELFEDETESEPSPTTPP